MAQELYAAQASAGKRSFAGERAVSPGRDSTERAMVIYPNADDFRFGIAGALAVVLAASLERRS
jgi:hypothetical protein